MGGEMTEKSLLEIYKEVGKFPFRARDRYGVVYFIGFIYHTKVFVGHDREGQGLARYDCKVKNWRFIK